MGTLSSLGAIGIIVFLVLLALLTILLPFSAYAAQKWAYKTYREAMATTDALRAIHKMLEESRQESQPQSIKVPDSSIS
jgi:hypothetical protein